LPSSKTIHLATVLKLISRKYEEPKWKDTTCDEWYSCDNWKSLEKL